MYAPQIGRFLSQDPIGLDGGDVNLLRYVGNDPVNATDPSGLVVVHVKIYTDTWHSVPNAPGQRSESTAHVYVFAKDPSCVDTGTQTSEERYGPARSTISTTRSLVPLTKDEERLLAAAKGDERAERFLATLLTHTINTRVPPNIPVLGKFFPDTFGSICARWGCKLFDSLQELPVRDASGFTLLPFQGYRLHYPGPLGPDHFVILFKMPDGVVYGIDQGAFGNASGSADHIFFVDDILANKGVPPETREDLGAAVRAFPNKWENTAR